MTDHEILVFVTTTKCNLNCEFCQQKTNYLNHGEPHGDMSIEVFKKLLEKHPDNATITLSGGEPFMNLPIIEYLCEINKPFCVQTNGSTLLPSEIVLPKNSQLRISVNDLDFPPLFRWGLEQKDITLRINVYLDDPYKTFELILAMSNFPNIYDVNVHVDFYTDINPEMTQKVETLAKLCAKLPLPAKNARFGVLKGYDSYMRSLWHPGETFIYDQLGQRIPSIYAADIPQEKWKDILGPWVYKDYEIYKLGKSKYQEGHPENFSSPCAYYVCHFYESIKKERQKQIDAFNSFFRH